MMSFKSKLSAFFQQKECIGVADVRRKSNIIHEGFLKIATSDSAKAYERFYVVIAKTMVYYFTSEGATHLSGKFSLYGYNTIASPQEENESGFKFCLKHATNDPQYKTYYFLAFNQEEQHIWINKFRSATKSIVEEISQCFQADESYPMKSGLKISEDDSEEEYEQIDKPLHKNPVVVHPSKAKIEKKEVKSQLPAATTVTQGVESNQRKSDLRISEDDSEEGYEQIDEPLPKNPAHPSKAKIKKKEAKSQLLAATTVTQGKTLPRKENSNERLFWKKSKEEAHELIRKSPEGVFLVREGESGLVMSISGGSKTLFDLRILWFSNTALGFNDEKVFPSIQQLVSHFQKNEIVLESGRKILLTVPHELCDAEPDNYYM